MQYTKLNKIYKIDKYKGEKKPFKWSIFKKMRLILSKIETHVLSCILSSKKVFNLKFSNGTYMSN